MAVIDFITGGVTVKELPTNREWWVLTTFKKCSNIKTRRTK